MKTLSWSTSRRLVLQTGVAAGVAAGFGLLAARTSPGLAAESLPLIKKPIPSSQELLPAVRTRHEQLRCRRSGRHCRA